MDFTTSLDDIIKSKRRLPSRDRHSHRASSTSRLPSSSHSPRTFSFTPDSMTYYLSRYERDHQDLRTRISQFSTRQRQLRGRSDLRERIGKRTSNSSGLSTSNLPNRQRMKRQQRPDNGYDNDNDNGDCNSKDSNDKRDDYSIIITKPVYRNDSSSSSPTASRRSAQLDPTSIVIKKAVKQQSPPPTTTSTTPNDHIKHDHKAQQASALLSPPPPPLPAPVNGDAERLLLQQYIEEQRQEQLHMRKKMEQEMQQQLKAQNEQILELQRLLSNQNQQATIDLTHDRQYSNPSLPTQPPPSNTVLISNLDSMTTSTDVEIVCGEFGIVVRCDVARDTQGRSGGEAEVEFLDHDSALNCIAKFDNELVDGRVIRATLRQPPSMHPHTMRSVIAPTRSGYRTTSQVLYTNKRS